MANTKTTVQLEEEFLAMFKAVQPFTMLDWPKAHNLYTAVRYVVENDIPGDFVECGVWRGGSCMLMAFILRERGITDRHIYLYDTFAGMTEPTEHDIKHDGEHAGAKWREQQTDTHNQWCFASIDEVRQNVLATRYPPSLLHFVKGPVEDTIPGTLPADDIALLRLDTDFYESSYHELVHLYPQLVTNGVLILDDFSYWQGQREATLRYFEEQGVGMMLTRISTSATGVKVDPVGLTHAERAAEQSHAAVA